MAVVPRVCTFFVIALASLCGGARTHANPIRRVITMLQMMMKKAEEQATKEEQLFDNFMCSCKTNLASLRESTGSGQDKIPQLESSIQETAALSTSLNQEVIQAREDRTTAENSLKEAKALRESDSKTFKKESTESRENIKGLTGAVAVLEKGMSQQEFAQTDSAPLLQGLLTVGKPAKAYDREALSAFLQQGDQTEDSGEILGILRQMKEDMEDELKDMINNENDAIAQFGALNAAKSKEIASASSVVEEKSMRLATAKVQLVQLKADLRDTTNTLAGDRKTLGDLKETCMKRDTAYGVLKKQFADEKVALAQTIKILADDAALDLFRKTAAKGASASAATFLQIGSASRWNQQQALELIKKTSSEHPDQPALQLIAKRLAHATKKGKRSKKGFDKIVVLIDNMINLLVKEGKDEAMKKEMCEKGLAKNEDLKANLETTIKSKGTEVANLHEQHLLVENEMAQLSRELAASDETVKEATKQRQEENTVFTEMLSNTNQAVGILEVAKQRLKDFYQSDFLQSRSEQREEAPSFFQEGQGEGNSEGISDEFKFMDDTSSGNSGVARHQKKPQTDAAKTVLTMIQQIQMDLKSEFSEAKKEESEAQAEYENLLADAQKKRETTARAMTEKEGAKAGFQEELKRQKDRKNVLEEELHETTDVISDLHDGCDKLLANFEERTKLRNAEKEALQRAKAVLAGADFKS